jgi:hypothetical protein
MFDSVSAAWKGNPDMAQLTKLNAILKKSNCYMRLHIQKEVYDVETQLTEFNNIPINTATTFGSQVIF